MAKPEAAGADDRPTRDRILRAGVRLFQAQGYHGTGIAAILERSRAPKGSFYHHFPDGKEGLAVAAVQWLAGEIDRFLDERLAAGADGAALAIGLAEYAALGLAHAGSMRGSLIAVLAAEAVPGSAAIGAALQVAMDGWLARLARGFAAAGPAEAAARARQVVALVEGATVVARIASRPEDAVAIVRHAMEQASAGRGENAQVR